MYTFKEWEQKQEQLDNGIETVDAMMHDMTHDALNDLLTGILAEVGVDYVMKSKSIGEKLDSIIQDVKALAILAIVENQYLASNKPQKEKQK